jgi:hypothetical protein
MQTQSFHTSSLTSAVWAKRHRIFQPSRFGTRCRILATLTCLLVLLLAGELPVNAQTPATPAKHEHEKRKSEPSEPCFEHEAFVLSFDDVDGDVRKAVSFLLTLEHLRKKLGTESNSRITGGFHTSRNPSCSTKTPQIAHSPSRLRSTPTLLATGVASLGLEETTPKVISILSNSVVD